MPSETEAAVRRTEAITRHVSFAEDPILFESNGYVRTYILNRPKKLNALDTTMYKRLWHTIQDWNESSDCKMIIARGSGRVFCAGGDMADVLRHAAKDSTRPKALDFFRTVLDTDCVLSTLNKPYIAIMDGLTIGGGVGFCAPALFRIATENTIMGAPETKIGYPPAYGATYIFNQLDGELGTYLSLTGENLRGRAVYELGLATHYIPSHMIPGLLESLASLQIISSEVINETIEKFQWHSNPQEPSSILTGSVRVALDSAFSHSSVKSIMRALETLTLSKENKVKTWATHTLDGLHMRSPTALVIGLQCYRNSRDGDLAKAFQVETGIAAALCGGASQDCITGIQAVVLDKTLGRPAWLPMTIWDTDEPAVLETFFGSNSHYHGEIPPECEPRPRDPRSARPYMRYALPGEADIQKYWDQHVSITREEVVQYFVEVTKGKDGVERKVLDFLK